MARKPTDLRSLQLRFHAFMEEMRLTPVQAAALCGMTTDYVTGLPQTLAKDLPEVVIHRMRMAGHLHAQLDMLFPDADEGFQWMNNKHGVFGGVTPLEYLMNAPFAEEAMFSLIEYLDNYLYRRW